MYSSTAQLNWQRRTGRLEARLTALYPLSYRWAASGRCWGPLWLRRERGDGGLKQCRGSRGEDVSSRREDRSEGVSGDVAARGGRTSQTRQVHAAQKRKDYSCDPFESSTWSPGAIYTQRKDCCIFSPAERQEKKNDHKWCHEDGRSDPTWYVKVFWRLDGGGCVWPPLLAVIRWTPPTLRACRKWSQRKPWNAFSTISIYVKTSRRRRRKRRKNYHYHYHSNGAILKIIIIIILISLLFILGPSAVILHEGLSKNFHSSKNSMQCQQFAKVLQMLDYYYLPFGFIGKHSCQAGIGRWIANDQLRITTFCDFTKDLFPVKQSSKAVNIYILQAFLSTAQVSHWNCTLPDLQNLLTVKIRFEGSITKHL